MAFVENQTNELLTFCCALLPYNLGIYIQILSFNIPRVTSCIVETEVLLVPFFPKASPSGLLLHCYKACKTNFNGVVNLRSLILCALQLHIV